MRSLILAGMIALIAGQAAALRCTRPDPVRAFTWAAEAEDIYYVLYGTLDFDETKQPKGVENNQRSPAPIPAFFRGNGLSDTGFNLQFEQSVVLQNLCAGPWCGQTEPHVPALIFARVEGARIIVDVGPCGGQVFLRPDEADLAQMGQCMSGSCN